MELISKQQAKELGLKKFFTGISCSKGHVSERYVVSRMCVECASSHNTAEGRKDLAKQYRKDNKEKTQQYRKDNLDKRREWLATNKDKTSAHKKTYRQNHSDVVLANNAKRRTSKQKRNAKWDIELTDLVVVEAYHLCELRENITGFSWHVDHVIPLNGKVVSGLHVWNNLAVIPAAQNLSKGNRYTTE